MVYDAENRMTSAVNGYHQYRYDADGKRTRKLVTGSPELWLVYGLNGELVAEYDAVIPGGTLKKEYGYRGGQMLVVYDAGQSGDNRLKWVVTDHLGSTRMLVNRSGGLCGAIERLDYLPFGEELASTIGHRNATCSGYSGVGSMRQKFTGYERDSETSLDFAQARYFSNMQGRFTSPDPLLASGRAGNPQSWNRFAYAFNNPMAFIDPSGMEGETPAPVSSGPSDEWLAWWQNDMEEGTSLKVKLHLLYDSHVMKGYKRKRSYDKDGKAIWTYEWVNDTEVHDIPNNYQYIDVKGRAIQLYGDDSSNKHGWGIIDPAKQYTNSDQTSLAPASFVSYGDTRSALVRAGFEKFTLPDPHYTHWGGIDFGMRHGSPSLHITLFPSETCMGIVVQKSPLAHVTIHSDRYSQIGLINTGRHLFFEYLKIPSRGYVKR